MARLQNEVTDPHSSKPLAKTDLRAVTVKAITDRSPIIINRILDFVDKYHDSDDEGRRKEAKAFELKILDKIMPKEIKISHHHEGYIEGNLADLLIRMSNGKINRDEAMEVEAEIIDINDDVDSRIRD